MNRALDALSAVVTPFVAAVSALQARLGPERLPATYRVWDLFRTTPVRHHYYQPVFDGRLLPGKTWDAADPLLGVDMNTQGQLDLLRSFDFNRELESIPVGEAAEPLGFYHNLSFPPADAETLYNVVRHFKPQRVIEIGSGYSTRMMKKALDRNREEGVPSSHICIEPYEMPWLESLGLEVIRSKVEEVAPSLFDRLGENDILFIDSSHVIRTGGDVIAEYLRIIPSLRPGVLVHLHDIFLPFEYPRFWVIGKRRFWTEQYLLQAFLAFNSEFEVLLAVNYLASSFPGEFGARCPVFRRMGQGRGSFWIRRKLGSRA